MSISARGLKARRISSTLIVSGPTSSLTERAKYVIDQYVMSGGKLVVMEPGYKINQQSGQAEMQMDPLGNLLQSYGLKINTDVVCDLKDNLPIPAGNMGGMPVYMPYPPIPKIIPPYGFPSDNAATRGLSALVIPWVSSIQLLYDKIPKDTKIDELAKTGQESFSHPVPVDLNPQKTFEPPGGKADLKPQLVAVELTGVFNSAYAGQAVPAMDPKPGAAADALPETDSEPMVTKSPATSIVVIGNSDFMGDKFEKLPGDHEIFFMNLMEALNMGDKLISIRSRQTSERPLNGELKDANKNALRFWGFGAVPIVWTLFGLAMFYLKAQRKRLLQAMQRIEKG